MTTNAKNLRKNFLHDLKGIAANLRDLRYFVEKYQSGPHHESILEQCDGLVRKHDAMFVRMEELFVTLESVKKVDTK